MTGRAAVPFARTIALEGWSPRSAWGFDAELECFWVELWRDGEVEPAVHIGAEHLVPTVPVLARAVARVAGLRPEAAFLALTA